MPLRRVIVGSILGAAALISAAMGIGPEAPTAQAAETDWKMHMVWVPARPEAQAYQAFVDRVNERAGDRLNIKLFASGSLGIKDADILRILPRGSIIQAAGLYPGYLTRDRPEYAYILPPGVISQPETLKEILPQLANIYGKTYDDVGIKLLGFIGHAVRDTHILCKEPIHSLEQLRGKKLRVWEQFHVDVFKKLGVSAQIIGQNDLYVAMQTGVVDCAVYPIGLAVTVSLQEVAPYASYLFPYVLHPLNLLAAQSSFDALSPDLQKVLEEEAKAAQEASFASYLSGENDEKALKIYQEGGGTLIEPFPEADQASFTKAARETWHDLSMSAGKTAQENYEVLRKVVE
ncbi:TRAP transporter substrate-binding protein DctP [Rhodoligotrophos defluvii]|uniref:TRAP transporter substrate-binding protein DctP n=1 Tax=Rhodoligotrophos defluvii TaxID=2561934 RepID=UPI0010C97729|nr:TRAP transporter substrate-binding protein DctP [Rhodoligotrophos defluvii]